MAGSSTEELIRWQYSGMSEEDSQQSTNIWKMMNYIPPRGPCGYKPSIVSGACTCLRFMINPISGSANSFNCDGCQHHASFHQMHARIADEIMSRWTKEDGSFDKEAYEADEEVQEVLERRRRMGTSGELSTNGGVTMPGKARATLLSQPTAKKRRAEKS